MRFIVLAVRRSLPVLLGVSAFFACACPSVAAPIPESVQPSVPQELYGGVVANETITRAGEDFYQFFAADWRNRSLSERYAISIHERPSARWGSTIWIEYAQRRVFQAALPPALSAIQALSARAVDIAYAQVTQAEVDRLLFRDADLGSDEI